MYGSFSCSRRYCARGIRTGTEVCMFAYADWVIVSIHCRREYLDQPSRRLFDILQEMTRTVAKLGLAVDQLPEFTTVCKRKQDRNMRIWRVLLRLSVSLHELGDVQSIFFALTHRFGEMLWARTWVGRSRELVLTAPGRNIEHAVKLWYH